MTFSNSIKWITVLTISTSAMPTFAKSGLNVRAPQSSSELLLENQGFQDWSNFLIQGKATGDELNVHNQAPLLALRSYVQDARQVISVVNQAVKPIRVSESQDYVNLAQYLIQFRQILRESDSLSVAEKKKVLFVVQMMAEEALYVGQQKFSNFPKELSIVNIEEPSLARSGQVREFRVQTGDILVGKSSGSGSSSLIALSMDEPHIFSHSTPVYIDAHRTTLSPEGFIEDGVKLRNLQTEYASDKKTRLYVYRLKKQYANQMNSVEKAMGDFVAEMQRRTGGKADTMPAFAYDFSMNPGEIEKRGLFCSSVSFEVYNRAGVDGSLNPYFQNNWSSISNARHSLLQILGVHSQSVPAPGDVEVNSDYEMVGVRINIEKLGQERIELALFDVIFAEALSEPSALSALASEINALNEKPIDKRGLEELVKQGVIPAGATKVLENIPNDIKPSQLILFGLMNKVLTPQVRDFMMKEVEKAKAAGHIVSAFELRQTLRANGQEIRKAFKNLVSELEKANKQI